METLLGGPEVTRRCAVDAPLLDQIDQELRQRGCADPTCLAQVARGEWTVCLLQREVDPRLGRLRWLGLRRFRRSADLQRGRVLVPSFCR